MNRLRLEETDSYESEERYRALFELCPLPACVYELATLKLLAVNDAMIRQYGYERAELLGMTLLDIVAPRDVGAARSFIESVRAGRVLGPSRHERPWRHRKKGGAEIDVDMIGTPLLYRGRPARLVLQQDVTARKSAEQELVTRAKLAAFRADIGTAIAADEPWPKALRRVTSALCEDLDARSAGVWVRDEVSGELTLQACCGDLDIRTARALWLSSGATWIGRSARDARTLVLDASGDQMPADEAANALGIGISHIAAFALVVRGRCLGVLTVGRASPFTSDLLGVLEVTAQQVAQGLHAMFAAEALRVSESHNSAILDNMLSGVLTLNDDGVIESVNQAVESTFGFTPAELVGLPFVALFTAPKLATEVLLERALGRVTEHTGVRKNGSVFPFELSLFQLESLKGSGFAAVVRDVSERYEVERLKSEFVSVVSHELRTPLTALRGSIGLLAGGVLGELPGDVMELLGIAERNTMRLIALVNDILDLERMQKGSAHMHMVPVAASDIVRRSVESVKPVADEAGIAIDAASCDEEVRGDGDRLVQVLVNLLSNAIKFSSRGSRVVLTADPQPRSVLFSVTDHGRGVPATHLHLVFERFQQVHSADSREKGGTGLGLSISKAIVEQHGGSIGVESEVGVGSTFWIRIPRVT